MKGPYVAFALRWVSFFGLAKIHLAVMGVILVAATNNAYAQEYDILGRSVFEFRVACTSKQIAGLFHRVGSYVYECFMRNGDRATALTVKNIDGQILVIGIAYETRQLRVGRIAAAMDWLGLRDALDNKPTKQRRGSDDCVFREWRRIHTTSLLLSCARKATVVTMLRLPEPEAIDQGKLNEIE